MNKFNLNIKEASLKLFNNELVIVVNYQNVIDINSSKVVLLNYIIEGDDLLVKKMDTYEIEIKGVIKKITVN